MLFIILIILCSSTHSFTAESQKREHLCLLHVTNGVTIELFSDDELTEKNLINITKKALQLHDDTHIEITLVRLNTTVQQYETNPEIIKKNLKNRLCMLVARIPLHVTTPLLPYKNWSN